MKKIIPVIFALGLLLGGCQKFDPTDIWDNIHELDKRVTALEELCREMNTNISSLRTIISALEKQDYIKNVSPIVKNGEEIGYTITFAYSGTITIYHGEDGADGKDGQDGVTPIIGVMMDVDGIYYWTLNGTWLLDDNGQKIKAVGTDGKDGADGADGSDGNDGAPGQNGADGEDGITPQLKIENGMWYVSYDNGASWVEVGQATGDQGPQGETGATGPQGPQGNPGEDGDSMFLDIDYSSVDYVIFTLSNGQQLKLPTWAAFDALQKQCEQMNKNVEALSVIVNAFQNNDYVTSVTPIYEGGKEIGYTINFSKGGKATIYHGKDGQNGSNGTNGVDGQTPVIGVAKDTDGIYYWTVNGAWLLDENGQKIQAIGRDGQDGNDGANGSNGSNGNDGAPGQDGVDGKDGITPQLKIENGMWYVSYDNGASWVEVGQATGDQGPQGEQGEQGKPGVSGDSMFTDVNYSDSDYVVFTLSNGEQFKIPTWSAFEALKQQCEQMNANIEALSVIVNALQNNDYVTSVTPIYEGGKEIGYIINFSKGGKATIYHGKDGQNGTNGTNGVDGQTPLIGVAKDIDGIYYWTVNGAWLLDENGQKVKAVGIDGQNGSNGSNGNDGAPGQNGADGITPKLKIENGKWYVSYDNGASWIEVGQATGDQGPQGETGATGPQGPQGNPGQDGDAFFQGVDYQSSADYVIFTLADGTQFKIPTWSAFEALKQQCEQMNANIEALSVIVNALQNNDYVTSVTPIYEGGKEIGYIINFSKGGKATIYHGKDGQNGSNGNDGAPGVDGKDGVTPVIGVAKDTDGVYYWTVNGSWLLDENGQKVKAVGIDGQNGSNGNDGAPGQNGAGGKDGITPQLKIENGKWHVSYDNGASWIEVGQATGDQGPQGETGATGPQGPQGNPGQEGDAFFQGVDYQSSADYVIFTLADGTQFKVPTWSAFEALKQQCEQINANIEALSVIVNALQNNDYVTSVTPIYEGGKEIGYIINFSKGGKATIYHGKDGQNGTNGTNGVDGQTPLIGVAKDIDGIYYWTVNGAWLLDENGQKVKAVGIDGQNGSNGSNGNDGAPGQNGADGITPKLKIEDGKWYVSYDNGASWIEVGQATGDQGPQGEVGATGPQGPQGNPGQDGDSFFRGVDYQSNKDYVIFTLADGTKIKLPTWSAFEALKKQCEWMNSDIDALYDIVLALQLNDYVTGVATILKDGKVIGYTIYFSKTGPVTIYHGKDGQDGADGKDGQDGADGKDGQTPIVGVAKDTDGIYYWTLNGSWLLDENGQKLMVVGRDGADGGNGSNGTDGITPKLNIEDGRWYVSYDNGVSWIEIGQATGDQGPQGPAGSNGQNGDSFFQSVTQDDENVYLVLADGTKITVSKIPPVAATLTLNKVTGFTATFNGVVNKTSRDLKVTVYYSTTDNLTVYKNKGKVSVTEFNGDTFTLKLTELAAETTYYYFTEVVCNGNVTFTDVDSFRTGKADSYVDWGEGENVGGEI